MPIIVPETPEHYSAIRQLTIDAFQASELGHSGEADLIETVRQQCDHFLSLVALEDEKVVGHVMFTPAMIRSDSLTLPGMALGPMAVLPSRQRTGIGSALVMEGLRRIDESGAGFVVVMGHPDYYPRFGFKPAADYGVVHGYTDIPQEYVFLRPCKKNWKPLVCGGRVYFDNVFGRQFSN
jgi:putative acetyltransferase